MAYWIKANPKVVAFLHLEDTRNQLKDGNYLLWQADLQRFGSLTRIFDICAEIGAIAMRSHEAKQEQDGIVLRTLPTANDPRFIMDQPVATPHETQPENGEVSDIEIQPEQTGSEPLSDDDEAETETNDTENDPEIAE